MSEFDHLELKFNNWKPIAHVVLGDRSEWDVLQVYRSPDSNEIMSIQVTHHGISTAVFNIADVVSLTLIDQK